MSDLSDLSDLLMEIEPPPGLAVEPEGEERPKPRIAYHVKEAGKPPSSPTQAQAKKTNGPTQPQPNATEGSNPMVRFCVFCGMQVAPKLISAKFCVYCGNVHNGQVIKETPPSPPSPPTYSAGDYQSLAPYSSTADKGYTEALGMPSSPDYYTMMAWQGRSDWQH